METIMQDAVMKIFELWCAIAVGISSEPFDGHKTD